MHNIRVRFVRGEQVKYISHLDLIKVFERAMRRAKIPLGYSQGFNPHPQMVFGLPLSVGVTSDAEYADFDFDAEITPEQLIERLNKELPSGLKLMLAKQKQVKGNIMAAIQMASYDIMIQLGQDLNLKEITSLLQEFMQQSEIEICKRTKNGNRNVNIRPMIHELSVKESNQEKIFCISSLLSAGSAENLKPEFIIAAFREFAKMECEVASIHRSGLFVKHNGSILDPLDTLSLTS
jgi:radical SAM-linked protein